MKRLVGALYLFLVLMFIFAELAIAEQQVEIFPLQHRTAEAVRKQVEPLLLEGERISVAESHLILIASQQTAEAVSALLRLIDREQSQYLVQVRWVDSVTRNSGVLSYDSRSGQSTVSATGRVLGTSQKQTGQMLAVIEGESAFIVTGQDIPYSANWAVWSGRYSQGFTRSLSFQKVRSGFSITVNRAGEDILRAVITPQLMEAEPGTILNPGILTLDRLATTIQLKPGSWIDLAGFLPESQTGTQILAGSEIPLPAGRSIQLRIDEQK